MKEDITPSLIESVNKSFEANYNSSPQIEKLLKKETKTYKDAYRYAEQVGQARALSYMDISSEVLPDGKMYYNIASRLMEDTLGADQQMIAEYAASAQETANKKSGINLKAQKADLNQDRIDGFVNRLSSEETFDDVAWILNEPVKTFARSVVDDTVKKNAEFQNRAGVKATVVRTSAPKCCEWCSNLAGTYTYPRVAGEVFARHDSCRCTLDYEGRRLSAYTSKAGRTNTFRDLGEQEKIEKRIQYEQKKTDFYVGKNQKILPERFREWIGTNKMQEYLESVKSAEAKNYIRADFRKTSFIGDGGTAAIRRFEKETGLNCGRKGKDHSVKVSDLIRQINRTLLKDIPESDKIFLRKRLAELEAVAK